MRVRRNRVCICFSDILGLWILARAMVSCFMETKLESLLLTSSGSTQVRSPLLVYVHEAKRLQDL